MEMLSENPPQINTATLVLTTLCVPIGLFIGHLALNSLILRDIALLSVLASPYMWGLFPKSLLRDYPRQTTLADFGGGV